MAAVRQIPLLLCCAEDNEVALVRVIDILHREGYAPEIVSGVEHDTALLTAAVDRIDGPALFVFCSSAELDRGRIRRLMGLFSARKGTAQHSLTVQLRSDRPLTILPPIRTALARVARGDDAGNVTASSSALGGRSGFGDARVDPRSPPRRERQRMAVFASKLQRHIAASQARRRSSSKPARFKQPAEPELGSGVPQVLHGTDYVRIFEPSSGEYGEAGDSDELQGDFDRRETGQMPAQTSAQPSAPLTSLASVRAPRREAPRGHFPVVFGSAVCTVAVVLLGSLSLRDDARVETPAVEVVERVRPAAMPERAEREPEPQELESPTPTRPALPPPPEAMPAERSAHEAADEPRRVEGLRVIDVSEAPMTWREASTHCAELKVMADARLPTRAELLVLARYRMLVRETFWSSESGEHDDEAHAFDVHGNQMNVYLREEPIAHAVCIDGD